MWVWLLRALNIAGTAALGYFANDIGDGFTRYFPGSKNEEGRIPWYWLLIIFFILAGAFVFIVSLIIPKKYQKP